MHLQHRKLNIYQAAKDNPPSTWQEITYKIGVEYHPKCSGVV